MIIEKEGAQLSLQQFEKLSGSKWISGLDFTEFKTLTHVVKKCQKLHKKGEMTLEQLWLGKYFKKELLSKDIPGVAIRWINDTVGWGVFAAKPFKKMEFVAEYTGNVRKRKRSDSKNAYCFEYAVVQGIKSPYTIDAMEQGGLSRYINHSSNPNLISGLATFDNVSHVILYAKEPIAIGAQLCYDYGPDYWSKRTAPLSL
jgi:hypothetical protein